jgi:chromosome segregation ATPase
MVDPDLNFIARQIERLIRDNAVARDEIRVLTAIVMRVDTNQAAMLDELRAMHAQITRMNDRVRQLENALGGTRPNGH